jgi:hypothetical protein
MVITVRMVRFKLEETAVFLQDKTVASSLLYDGVEDDLSPDTCFKACGSDRITASRVGKMNRSKHPPISMSINTI